MLKNRRLSAWCGLMLCATCSPVAAYTCASFTMRRMLSFNPTPALRSLCPARRRPNFASLQSSAALESSKEESKRGNDEKIERAKALIEKVQAAPRGRGGELRGAEQREGGAGGVFQGLVIAVTGNFDKSRTELEARIRAQDAIYSGTVHKRVDFLFCDQAALESRTKHVRKAEKHGTKIVSAKFLDACEVANKRTDHTPFILTPPPPPASETANGLDGD